MTTSLLLAQAGLFAAETYGSTAGTEPSGAETTNTTIHLAPPSRFGTRYLEVTGDEDPNQLNDWLGHAIFFGAKLNLPLFPHWDASVQYGYYTFTELPASYGNSGRGAVAYHRTYGKLTAFAEGTLSGTRAHYHDPFFSDDYDYGSWGARIGVEYIPHPRLVLNVQAQASDFLRSGDDLGFSTGASATLWLYGPLGFQWAGALGEQGETASSIGAIARVAF